MKTLRFYWDRNEKLKFVKINKSWINNIIFQINTSILSFLAESGITVIFNSPYSLQINFVEYAIKLLKEEFRNM